MRLQSKLKYRENETEEICRVIMIECFSKIIKLKGTDSRSSENTEQDKNERGKTKHQGTSYLNF